MRRRANREKRVVEARIKHRIICAGIHAVSYVEQMGLKSTSPEELKKGWEAIQRTLCLSAEMEPYVTRALIAAVIRTNNKSE